jgi:hypothetical protein
MRDGGPDEKRLTFRYATAADVDRYYDERPEQTIRAIVILLNDEPVGIVGLAYEGDRYTLFSEYKPALEPHLKSMTVLRAVHAAHRMVRAANLPVLVVNTSNPALLERMGFREIEPGVHLCHS